MSAATIPLQIVYDPDLIRRFDLDFKRLQVRHQFAWIPTFIRDGRRWVWLRRYTRLSAWSNVLGRQRTIHTCLGWAELMDSNAGVLN